MMIKKNKFKWIDYWLAFLIIPSNIFGEWLHRVFIIDTEFLSMINIVIFIIICLFNKGDRSSVNKYAFLFLIFNILLFSAHTILFGFNFFELKNLMYIVLFVVSTMALNYNTFILVKKVLTYISVFMICDALIKVPMLLNMNYRLFNIRNFTVVDKTWYTLVLSIVFVLVFNDVLNDKVVKNKVFSWILLISIVIVNVFVIESKTFILAVAASIFFEMFIIQKVYRKKIMKLMLYIATLGVGFIIFSYDSLPDYVKATISSTFGVTNPNINSVYYESSSARDEGLNIVYNIFVNNPIFGVGFGNYSSWADINYNRIYTKGINDVESSFLGMIAEGGFIYFIANVLLLCYITNKAIRADNIQSNGNIEFFSLLVCLFFLIMGNDFMGVIYWTLLGIIFSIVCSSKSNNTAYI